MNKLLCICLFFLVPSTFSTKIDIDIENENSLIELTDSNFVNIRLSIDDKSMSNVITKLHKLKNKEVFIYINSFGGSVSSGNTLVEHIKSLQNKEIIVSCIADKAMSMAFIIFQHCTNRYILDSSILMQHQMSLGIKGPIRNIDNYLKMINNMENSINEYQAKRLNIDVNEFKELTESDWWLYGKDILKFNAADKIVSVYCTNDLYSITDNIQFETFFGMVDIKFSRCPLVQYPVDIEGNLLDNDEYTKNEVISTIMASINEKYNTGYYYNY